MSEIKKKALIALKKAKTSLEKNIEMIENDAYCEAIMIQNMAAIWLIQSSNKHLLEAFLINCEVGKMEEKKQKLIQLFALSHK